MGIKIPGDDHGKHQHLGIPASWREPTATFSGAGAIVRRGSASRLVLPGRNGRQRGKAPRRQGAWLALAPRLHTDAISKGQIAA